MQWPRAKLQPVGTGITTLYVPASAMRDSMQFRSELSGDDFRPEAVPDSASYSLLT